MAQKPQWLLLCFVGSPLAFLLGSLFLVSAHAALQKSLILNIVGGVFIFIAPLLMVLPFFL